MSRTRLPKRVVVEARAKLNLGLAVGPKRPDGYHDLVTVFQSISLADTLTAERTARGFSVRVRHEAAAIHGRVITDRALVPAGADNLVLRAARLLHDDLALPGGVRFTLTKRIPAQAGMGGGSADAAAALHAVLALHGKRVPLAVRLRYALQLGSDVPFSIYGGTALGQGRGEILSRLQLVSPFRALIAMPKWRVSTRDAFQRHDASRNGLTGWEHHRRFAVTVGRQRVEALKLSRRGNRFEALLGSQQHDLDSLRARLRAAGLLEPRLTGSGSAVFGIVPGGVSIRDVVARFTGDEPLYAVRSVGKGLRLL
ncbi:MAG: 4-(cytidine 5'-diphospho)-2-C-methyl-D-erythritol kinase [Candidatus Eisenbacteria bacterium]|nr:4-(cytidine 5'-diphospho)-2-C-methyl-D-erythritol kinase [Candidatus Eisenbacteria bacterium]